MAIIIKQDPMHAPEGVIEMLAGTIYPLYSTWSWTTGTALYSDFKFITKVLTEDGLLSQFSTVSEDDTNWSKLSVTDLLKNKLVNLFQPKAKIIDTNPGAIINYKMEITPFNNGELVLTDSATTDTMYAIKSSQMKYYLNSFLNHDIDKMLVDVDHHYYSLDSYATNKALYGRFGYTYGTVFNSLFDNVIYIVEKASGVIEYYELLNLLTPVIPTADDELNNTDTMLTEIPTGPKNMSSTWFTLTKVEFPDGITITPGTHTQMHLENGDKYKYAAYDGKDKLSKWYNNTVRECTTRYTPMPISWLNETGAYDTFLAYAKSEKTIENKNKTYVKSNYNRVSDKYYVDSTTNKGETVYDQEIKETYIVSTDWVTDEDVTNLESLWTSPDVYIQLGGDHYPVINITKKVVMKNPKTPGLFKYELELLIATKKLRI